MKLTPCAAAGVVLAFSLATGACGSDGDPPRASATTTAAESFTSFAQGGRADVPWADPVTYLIGGRRVARFDPALAARRETWDGCPRGRTTYEGRDCPVSPLRTIALLGRDGGEVVYEAEAPPTVGCNRYKAAGGDSGRTTWIRPPEQRRDCFSDFAVAVSLDRSGRVVSVDFTLSGP